MVYKILIFILIIFIIISVKVGWAISLHSKRFGLPGDPKFKRVFNIFKIGSVVLILLGILFLILNIIGSG